MERSERREQILSAALELFADHGYHHTQISDIIEAAGIARGTFYLYFDSKRAIFSELLDRLFATYGGVIRRIDVGPDAAPVREQMRGNVERVIDTLVDNRDLVRILMRAAVGLDPEFDGKVDDFYRKILTVIAGSIATGIGMELVRDCDPTLGAMIVLGGLKEVAYQYLVADDHFPQRDHVVEQFLSFVIFALFRSGTRA